MEPSATRNVLNIFADHDDLSDQCMETWQALAFKRRHGHCCKLVTTFSTLENKTEREQLRSTTKSPVSHFMAGQIAAISYTSNAQNMLNTTKVHAIGFSLNVVKNAIT